MNKHANRRVRRRRGVEVEPLDRCTAIGKTLRLAQMRAGDRAIGGIARNDLRLVGRVFDLGIGVVQLLLIHIEKDPWTFLPNRRRLYVCRR